MCSEGKKMAWKTDGKLITHFYDKGRIEKSIIIQEGSNKVFIMTDKGIKRTSPAPSFEKARAWVKRYIKQHPRG
jgi:hypothetical protein